MVYDKIEFNLWKPNPPADTTDNFSSQLDCHFHIAQGQPYGCHCIVETELIQLGKVLKEIDLAHPTNLILGTKVVCISQPCRLRVVLLLYQQRHFYHDAEIIYSPKSSCR